MHKHDYGPRQSTRNVGAPAHHRPETCSSLIFFFLISMAFALCRRRRTGQVFRLACVWINMHEKPQTTLWSSTLPFHGRPHLWPRKLFRFINVINAPHTHKCYNQRLYWPLSMNSMQHSSEISAARQPGHPDADRAQRNVPYHRNCHWHEDVWNGNTVFECWMWVHWLTCAIGDLIE